MPNWCLSLLTFLHLTTYDEQVAKLDQIMEAAFQKDAEIEDYAKATIMLPRLAELLPKAEHPESFLQWVAVDEPGGGALYNSLRNLRRQYSIRVKFK